MKTIVRVLVTTGILLYATAAISNGIIFVVSPNSLSSTLASDMTEVQTLSITEVQGFTLTFNILEDDSVCDSPTDIPWLSVSPNAGAVLLDVVEVDVTFDSTGLAPGDYAAYLCVDGSNFLGSDTIVVPVALTVTPIEVALDINPGSCPNPLNCKSKGVIPVAILGTTDFDVTQIDPVTLRLAGASPLRWDIEDVATPFEPFTGKEDCLYDCNETGPDGYPDVTLKFSTQEVVAGFGEDVLDGACLVAELTGNLRESFGGNDIVGEDLLVVRCRGR